VQGYFIALEVKLKVWHDVDAAWSSGDGNGSVITCYPKRKASQSRFDRCHTTCSSGVDLILSIKEYVMVPVWLSEDAVCWLYFSSDFTLLDFFPMESDEISAVQQPPAEQTAHQGNISSAFTVSVQATKHDECALAHGASFSCVSNKTDAILNT
jgi:hypothetical protein